MKYKLFIQLFLFLSLLSLILFLSHTIVISKEIPSFTKTILTNSNGRVAIGDFNGDSKNDVIVHTWSQHRGDPDYPADGTLVWYKYPNWDPFLIKTDYFFGDAVVAVDLDSDGDTDVVTCQGSDYEGSDYWYENVNGLGTYWIEHHLGTLNEGNEVKDIAVQDLDNDNMLDIVSRRKSILRLYYQNGDTTWEQKDIEIPEREGMDVGDMDKDGNPDLVLNGYWLCNPGNRDSLWQKFDYDTLWFTMQNNHWSDNSVKIVVADINTDSNDDIILSCSEKTGYTVRWYTTLSPKQEGAVWQKHDIDTLDYCHTLQADDLNNDGFPDIVAGSLRRDNSTKPALFMFLNETGDGVTWNKIELSSDDFCYNGETGDLGSDGTIDFISSWTWDDGPIQIWTNSISSKMELPLEDWQRHLVEPELPLNSLFIFACDVNSDSFKDIITGGWWYENPGNYDTAWTRHTIGDPFRNIVLVYDLDNDGELELFGTEGRGSTVNPNFVWADNDGSGNFKRYTNIPAGAGDFLQGATVNYLYNSNSLNIALSWHQENNGIELLTVPQNITEDEWQIEKISDISRDEALSSGDIDKDGDIDLLLGTIWLENSDGMWLEQTLYNTTDPPDRNKLADINQDGKLDAVIGYESINTLGKLAWYEQPENPKDPWIEHIIAEIIGPMSLDVVDMNFDGDLDVVVGEHNYENSDEANLYIFENLDGFGNEWNRYLVYKGDEHHDGAQVVDIDNDGDLDIISIGWRSKKVVLYQNLAIENYPVPVEFANFYASQTENLVQLTWKIHSETNNYGFEIIRNNKKIAFVKGRGTINTGKTYYYTDTIPGTGEYLYELHQVDTNYSRKKLSQLLINYQPGPLSYTLNDNYPNPFNSSTTIRFTIPEPTYVELNIYNILGIKIVTLLEDNMLPGEHYIQFHASELTSGSYFYEIKTPEFSEVKKFVLLK